MIGSFNSFDIGQLTFFVHTISVVSCLWEGYFIILRC